ncbi:MAG: glycosyltransferase family 1 protein [Bacteroidota bacterium]
MKVLIIADPLDNQRAGVHVYLKALVDQLASQPTEHEYILVRERVDPNCSLHQIALPNTRLPIGYASFRLFVLIPRLARKLGVDVVFEPAHFGPFNLPRRIRRVTMIHDLTPILFGEFHRWHSQFLQKTFLKGILRRTDRVLTNSLNTQRDVERVYPNTKGKTEMILLGRDERFRPVRTNSFLENHQLERRYFLFVGTIEPRKNLSVLLAGYEQFRTSFSEAIDLVVVGQKGWKSEEFYKQLEQHRFKADIHLPGYIPFSQLLEAYSHSLALIYPSIYEGFGFPVLEGMACSTNVICSDNSSLPEVGGELAYYFTSAIGSATELDQSRDQLSRLMIQVAEGGEEVSNRRAQGPDWAASFSWKKYVEAFERLMRFT